MEAAMSASATTEAGPNIVRAWVQIWVDACSKFRQWERDELVKKRPSPETTARHRKLATALIRSAHILQALMEDPEYPARDLLPEVEGKLLQLEDSREMIHNAMSDRECDVLFPKYFPDESRPGRPS